MEENEILKGVAEFIGRQKAVPAAQVQMESSFEEDLEMDSLDKTEAIMALEDRFDIEIADAEAKKLRTVGDAVRFIAAMLTPAGA